MHRHRISVALTLLALAWPLLATRAHDAATSQERRCCFTNPAHAGVCVVVPGPEESCASILAYLNNPLSTGRTYCGNTKLRGGWQQVPCPESAALACGAATGPGSP